MKMSKSRRNFKEYSALMKHKFDLEDRMAKIFNERWKLNNENTKCVKQLRLVEDQIRSMFKRFRIELKVEEESS